MATLNVDDDTPPTTRTFCRRMTEEEHNKLVAQETENQLNALLIHLQQNPAVFAEFLQQRHAQEGEDAGFFTSLKRKFLSVFFGENYVNIDEETRDNKWEEFQATTINTYNTSQESKGNTHKFSRWVSKRIAERQQKNKQKNSALPPPAPPLPPIKKCTKKNDGPIHQQVHRKEKLQERSSLEGQSPIYNVNNEIKSMRKNTVKRRPLREVSNGNVVPELPERITKRKLDPNTFEAELVSVKSNLRSIGSPTCETRYRVSKQRLEIENEKNNFPLFNQELLKKFRNTRSPRGYSPGGFSPQGYSSGDSSECD